MSTTFKKATYLILFLVAALLSTQVVQHVIYTFIFENPVAIPSIDLKNHPLLFNSVTGIIAFLGSLIFVWMSFKLSVKKFFIKVSVFALSSIFLFFFIILPFNSTFALPDHLIALPEGFSQYTFLAKHWYLVIFYGLLTLLPSTLLLLFFSVANDVFTFQKASKFYPIFCAIATFLNAYIFPTFFPLSNQTSLETNTFFWGGILIALWSITFLCMTAIYREEANKDESTEVNSSLGWRYVASLGCLVACSAIIIKLAKTLWKYNVSTAFPSPSEYTHFLGEASFFQSIATLMTISILLFMSVCIKERLGRGWTNIYFAVSSVSLIVGGSFFICTWLLDPTSASTVSELQTSSQKIMTKAGTGYQILLSTVLYPIILCLKEIAIVPLPKKIRFSGKLIIDLIFIKFALGINTVILAFISLKVGSLHETLPYLGCIFFMVMAIRYLLIYYTGSNLHASINPTSKT